MQLSDVRRAKCLATTPDIPRVRAAKSLDPKKVGGFSIVLCLEQAIRYQLVKPRPVQISF